MIVQNPSIALLIDIAAASGFLDHETGDHALIALCNKFEAAGKFRTATNDEAEIFSELFDAAEDDE
jgi:hypothetical protein